MNKLVIWNPSINRNHWLMRTLGPYSVASWLRKAGCKAQVLEWIDRWDINELVEVTSKLVIQNGYVGVSSTFWGNAEPEAVTNARLLLKQMRPDIKWVIGGARHYIVKPGDYDITIKSFGEDAAIKAFNHGIGQIWHPSLEQEQFWEGDAILPGEVLPLALGRGCRFSCKFCGYPLIGRKAGTYERTIDNLMLDWDARKKLGASSVTAIIDDTINESDARIELLEAMKKHDNDFGWGGYLRADLIWSKEDQITRLPNSGLLTGFHGIESLHETGSKSIGKGWSGKHAEEWLPKLYNDTWGKQISAAFSLIIGLPGEPLESNRRTHQWIKDNFTTVSWKFCALTIARDGRDWPSEFDKSAEEYGYRFPYADKPNHWQTDIMDYYDALKLEWELNADPACSERMVTTNMFWAIGMGVPVAKARKMSMYTPEYKILTDNQPAKLAEYIAKTRSYWNV
jgi:hypothetical protein